MPMIRTQFSMSVSVVGLWLTMATTGFAADPQSSGAPGPTPGQNHVMPMTTPSGNSAIPQATPHLTYYGGPVLKNVHVIPVYWNSSVVYQANLNSFYSDFTSSNSSIYASLLTQYSGIKSGTRGTPYVAAKGTGKITDAQIQAFLTGLFNSGNLPKPTANTYYPVHFPAGVHITASDGSRSCVTWCAYHGTYVYHGVNVNYGVIPDQAACFGGCGGNFQLVNNLTSVSSHELVEATTDPGVGLATRIAPPLAWYDANNGEIGDICNGQQATITANGHTYVVQKEWSNSKNACRTN
jgi:hypothetical protein